LYLVKTSSGRVSPVRIVAAWQLDPEERLRDELDGEVDAHERNGDKSDDRHDRAEGEPDQPIHEGLRSRFAVVTVIKDATVWAAECRWRNPRQPRARHA